MLISFLILFFAGMGVVSFLWHRVPKNTVLKIVIEGNIAEEPAAGFSFFGEKTENMKDLLLCLDAASRDPRVSGVILEIKSFDAGFGDYPVPAKIQELRSAIQEVKNARKWTAAYMEDGDVNAYYLASACKEIFLLPTGILAFNGIHLEPVFIRGMLDKLGIKPELQHISPYKTAINLYTRKKMTKAQNEMDSWLLDSLDSQLLQDISADRKLPVKTLKSAVDNGVFLGEAAIKSGLVDKTAYPDQLQDDLKAEHGAYHPMNWERYLAKAGNGRWAMGKKIAIVYASGEIREGKSGYDPTPLLGGKILGSDTLSEAFKEIRKDPSIKAVVFRIDSPGGSVVASDIIRRAAELTAAKIPIVVSMSDVAASGGYFITTFNPPPVIFADPATLTASIGVITGKFNFKDFMEKLGITFDYVSRGKLAMGGDPIFDTPGEKEIFHRIMLGYYDDFVNLVAHSRHMSRDAVDEIGGGRVYTGEQAGKKGLVDRIGGLLQAVAEAKKDAGMRPGEPVDLVVFPKPKTLLQQIAEKLQGGSWASFGWPWRKGEALFLMEPVHNNFTDRQ